MLSNMLEIKDLPFYLAYLVILEGKSKNKIIKTSSWKKIYFNVLHFNPQFPMGLTKITLLVEGI